MTFLGTNFTRISVTVYPLGDPMPTAAAAIHGLAGEGDLYGGGAITLASDLSADFAYASERAAVVGFSYSHAINTSAPSCAIQIKARSEAASALLEITQPGFWVDVSVHLHDKQFHVFRGRIAGSSIEASAGGVGGSATSHVLTMHCRGFGYILEQHQVYYDIVTEGLKLAGAYPRILISPDNDQSVSDTIKSLLDGFLKAGESGTGRSLWELPESLNAGHDEYNEVPPVSGGTVYFRDALYYFPQYETRAIEDFPPRINSQSLSWIQPARGGESLWTILQRWNDNPLVDLYTELVDRDTGEFLHEGQECTPTSTAMAVILRDKPFPTVTRGDGATGDVRMNSKYWFDEKTQSTPDGYLPTYTVQWNDIERRTTTRSDEARKNAFFLAPILTQGLTGTLLDFQKPLWDLDSIGKFGFRPVFYTTPYLLDIKESSSGDKDYVKMLDIYRARLRDFLCLGAEYMSGSIELAFGRPDIRVGGKLVIKNSKYGKAGAGSRFAELSGGNEERFYIEGVSHRWSAGSGMRTSLTVTRGLRGDDTTRGDLLDKTILRYTKGVDVSSQGGET